MKRNLSSNYLSTRRSISSYDLSKQSLTQHTNNEKSQRCLDLLKTRHQKKNEIITSDLAGKVVKKYLLPMFEASIRRKASTDRKKAFHSTQNLGVVKGTVFEELKLSEKFMEEAQETSKKLEEKERITSSYMQEKAGIVYELTCLKKSQIDLASVIQSLRFENGLLQKELLMSQFFSDPTESELRNTKFQLHNSQKESERLSQDLQDCKAINDIRLR